MKKVPFTPAVPTTTLIISKKEEPHMVVVFESAGKHGNKKVIPGGRVKVGKESWLDTGITEAKEEVLITDLENIRLFAICSKTGRDVRKVSLEKYLDGGEIPTGFDPEVIEIEAHYGFDIVFMAESDGHPVADGTEGKKAFYLDVNFVDPNDFALDHGHLLVAYAYYLKTGELPRLNQF